MDQAKYQQSHIHRQLTVLHVEDSRVYHIGVKGVLDKIEECEFTIHNATTMEAAQRLVREIDFDIILLDLSLPDSSGLDTLIDIHKVVPSIPIVLFTGIEDEDAIIQGIRLGAQDYLPKSYIKPDLIKRVIFAAVDRKTVEEALKSSEERFELAVRGSSVGLWDWDIHSGELYWSDRFKEILGLTEQDYEPNIQAFEERLHPDDRSRIMQALQSHLEQGTEYDVEYRLQHSDGHYIWIHARGQAVWTDEGQPTRMAGSVDDITEKKQTEEDKVNIELQLRHAQKLESIGQLAAGVAHEINTPTQFVGDNTRFLSGAFADISKLLSLYSELLNKKDLSDSDNSVAVKIKALIDEIDLEYLLEEIPNAIQQGLEGVERIGSIVKAMKEFSHPGSNQKELTDLNKSIENTITVSRNEWRYVADMETNFDPELPMVECLPGEFNQTILNIIVNAAHAIADFNSCGSDKKGLITIATQQVAGDCEITITDTGGGIPDTIRNKIFDPFFTTKEVGRGTGQGLAITYSVIVDKHQGSIDVSSDMGKGTTFTIRMPIKSPIGQESIHGGYADAQKAVIC